MQIYDEENIMFDEEDDDMAGYTLEDTHSIFTKIVAPEEEETVASPIPQNEQTVILCDPSVARLHEGDVLSLLFKDEDGCDVMYKEKKIGGLKPAYVVKLKAEHGGDKATVYFKLPTPPMIRIVFGEGEEIAK